MSYTYNDIPLNGMNSSLTNGVFTPCTGIFQTNATYTSQISYPAYTISNSSTITGYVSDGTFSAANPVQYYTDIGLQTMASYVSIVGNAGSGGSVTNPEISGSVGTTLSGTINIPTGCISMNILLIGPGGGAGGAGISVYNNNAFYTYGEGGGGGEFLYY